MRQRLQLSIVLFLCVIATGAQWDLLQTFAWGRMMAGYSRAMPLSAAMAKTFDGEMCDLCRLVAKAKKADDAAHSTVPATRLESKALLFFQPVPAVIIALASADGRFPAAAASLTADRSAPPVPPPREARA